jgi:hypothetical protein
MEEGVAVSNWGEDVQAIVIDSGIPLISLLFRVL